MPLVDCKEDLGLFNDVKLIGISSSSRLLPADIWHRYIGGPGNSNFEYVTTSSRLPQRRSSANWAVSSALVSPKIT